MSISVQIKHLKKAKQDLIGKLKKRDQTSRFSVLSPDSKAALCTLAVLRRYLTKEILENEFLQMNKNAEGNIVFDRKSFEQSPLFDDAVHIYDYISVYLQQNPEPVVSENYFNKLFDKESGWRGIRHKADSFFEKLNKEKHKKSRAEIIAESRSDLEMIREYPVAGVVFVRLKTPEALDYEGAAAHHCVGGGSFDKLLDKEKSGIYSLRHLTRDGELKPVVTIELNGGEIKQIRGVCNSIVPYDYSLPARDAAMILLEKQTRDELVEDKKVAETVLNNLGLYRNPYGGYLDIHNLIGSEDFELPELRITADGLKDYEWDKLKIKDVRILGRLSDAAVGKYLEHMTKAQTLIIEDLAAPLELNLDKFDRLQKLEIISADGTSCRLWGQNNVLPELKLSNVVLGQPEEIAVKSLTYSVDRDSVLDVSVFDRLEKLVVNTKDKTVCSIKGGNQTLQFLKGGRLSFPDVAETSFPALKTLECAYAGGNVFSLSILPELEQAELSAAGQSCRLEGASQTLTGLSVSGFVIDQISAPNLRELNCLLNQEQNLDISSFPKLKKFIGRTTISDFIMPLKGNVPALTELKLCTVRFEDMSMHRFPALEKVSFDTIDLCQTDMQIPEAIEISCQNCLVDEKAVVNIYTRPNVKLKDCHHNTVVGTDFDFSQYSEYLNLDGLIFKEAKTIKFASEIKSLSVKCQVPDAVDVIGLNDVKSLIFSPFAANCPLVEKINPLTLKKLECHNMGNFDFDISRYTNLKELQGSGFDFNKIPPSVETLQLAGFATPVYSSTPSASSNDVMDFRRLINLRNLDIHMSSGIRHIRFPQNMKKLELGYVLMKIEELDFSSCHGLKELKLAFVAPELKRVSLPYGLEILQASRCESGIGIRSDGFERNDSLRIEIPSTAKPEIVKYLQEQWGNDRINVLPEKTETKQTVPILLLQNAAKRLK